MFLPVEIASRCRSVDGVLTDKVLASEKHDWETAKSPCDGPQLEEMWLPLGYVFP